MSERINVHLSQPLAEFVDRMVGEAGLYETPSDYVRDLIRRDMERRDGQFVQDAILAGYRDLAAGRVVASCRSGRQPISSTIVSVALGVLVPRYRPPCAMSRPSQCAYLFALVC